VSPAVATPRSFRLAGVVLALGLCTTGAACKKSHGSADRALLELRPVLAASPPPCATKAPPKGQLLLPRSADGKVAECLQLDKPIVDATDVRSATVGDTPAGESALSVVIGAVGSTNLDGYAQRNQGKRLAIVTRGRLVSAPVLQFTSFAGRVQVTGLSKADTQDLFQRLNKLIKG
jgi:preprotein translocase subunit SecD